MNREDMMDAVRRRLSEADQLAHHADDVGRYFAGAAHAYQEVLTMLTIARVEVRETRQSGVREIRTDTVKKETA